MSWPERPLAAELTLHGTTILSVSAVTEVIREALDDERLQDIWVRGEVTNYKHHSRGHRYFSLSEHGERGSVTINCVMWDSYARKLAISPANGMDVIVFGYVRLYAPQGKYQIDVQDLRLAGEGEKHLLVERWKRELAAEGIFSAQRKRALPAFPQKVGVVTSETGAVLHDIVNVLSRRYPVEVVLSPAAVQGETAHTDIVRALCRVDGRVDVIIIGRGGGSFEDLFPFNHPEVVRAIARCSIPVVAAIGHEVDITLSDLAADLRAPTPSAAAELVVPDRVQLQEILKKYRSQMITAVLIRIERGYEDVRSLNERLHPKRFIRKIGENKQDLSDSAERMLRSLETRLERERLMLRELRAVLKGKNPLHLLSAGYCVAQKDNRIVRSVAMIAAGDRLKLRFIDGNSDMRVEEVTYDKKV
jgi:exodeoxyribonuclease VII large subunit